MSPVLTVKHCANGHSTSQPIRSSTSWLNGGTADIHWGYEVALRDRFQGALMGLALVPVALQIDAIAYRQTPAIKLIETLAPGLLRHHDHWQRRRQWIENAAPSQTSVSQTSVSQTSVSQTSVSQTSVSQTSVSQTSIDTAQLLLAGDWLEAIITNKNHLSSFVTESQDRIESDFHRYNFSDEQMQCYQASHQCLHRVLRQNAVVSESYALSIQTVAKEIHTSKTLTEYESALRRTAIIGFLVGAAGGLAALPVLWQMDLAQTNFSQADYQNSVSTSRQAILIAANQLYEQWAGVLV